MLSLYNSESSMAEQHQYYQTPTYQPYLTPSSAESTDNSNSSKKQSHSNHNLLHDNFNTTQSNEKQQSCNNLQCQVISAQKGTMEISLADKVRMALHQQADSENIQSKEVAQKFEQAQIQESAFQNFINEYQNSEFDLSQNYGENKMQNSSQCLRLRPTNGIKFSKSAASLNQTEKSTISDITGGNITPASGFGRMRFSDFSVVSVLGEGSFGKVYHVVPKLQRQESANINPHQDTLSTTSYRSPVLCQQRSFALKVIEKKQITLEEKQHEVHTEKFVLSQLKSPSIIKIYSSFQDKYKLYFLLEYMPNGSLFDFLRREYTLNLKLTKHFSAEIIVALEYLRNNEIVHRDLKPGNILLDKNSHLKLIDFATAKPMNPELAAKIPTKKCGQQANINESDQRNYSLVGTEEYVSPEILLDKEVSYASDLWSLGIMIFQFLVGKTPFRGQTEFITFQNIISKEVEFPSGFNESAKDLIQKLLIKDPSKRLGANDINEVKNHHFFNDIQFDRIREQPVPCNSFARIQSSQTLNMHKRSSPSQDVAYSSRDKIEDLTDESNNNISEISNELQCYTENWVSEFLDRGNSPERKRSSSLKGSNLAKDQGNSIILKSGLLKKKGILFYNNRLVTLNARGILRYYDPKNRAQPRGQIDLNNQSVIVKFNSKQRDQFEIVTQDQTYMFKVRQLKQTLKELNKGMNEIGDWEQQIRRFIKVNCV